MNSKNTFLHLLFSLFTCLIICSCATTQDTTKKKTSEELFTEGKNYLDKEKFEDAKKIFESLTLMESNGDLADKAQFYLAESYFLNDEFKLATFHFNRLRALYPQSKYYSYSIFRTGESYEKSAPQYERDQQTLKYSIDQFKAFVQIFPNDALADSARKKIVSIRGVLAKKEIGVANHYIKVEEYRSAIIYLDKIIENYSDTEIYELAIKTKIECLKNLDEIVEAKKIAEKILSEFPKSKLASEINSLIK